MKSKARKSQISLTTGFRLYRFPTQNHKYAQFRLASANDFRQTSTTVYDKQQRQTSMNGLQILNLTRNSYGIINDPLGPTGVKQGAHDTDVQLHSKEIIAKETCTEYYDQEMMAAPRWQHQTTMKLLELLLVF